MMQTQLVVILLLLVLGAGGVTLFLDARQKRVDRNVQTALPTTHADDLPTLRRQQIEARWQFLYRLVNYKSGVTYVVRPEYVVLAGIFVAGAIFYGNRFLGFSPLAVSLAGLVAALITVRGLFGWQQRLVASRLFRQLPDTIQLVTSTVRSGLPVTDAFQIIAREMPQPTAGQFAIVNDEIRLAKTPDEALYGVYQRVGVTEYAMFSVALGVQMKTGGRLSETLETLSDSVRERTVLAARAKAMAGEVIFSARALSVSPVVVGGFLYWISPSMVDMLFNDPTGRQLLAYATISVIAGTLVIRWMVRKGTTI